MHLYFLSFYIKLVCINYFLGVFDAYRCRHTPKICYYRILGGVLEPYRRPTRPTIRVQIREKRKGNNGLCFCWGRDKKKECLRIQLIVIPHIVNKSSAAACARSPVG